MIISFTSHSIVTVKSFYFVGTSFQWLTTRDMFVDILSHGFQVIFNITKVNKYFIGILKPCMPTKYIKLNVQRMKHDFTVFAKKAYNVYQSFEKVNVVRYI